MTIKQIILFLVLSLLILSCDEDNEVKTYNSHDIILPNKIELDSFIVSIQLETESINEFNNIDFKNLHFHPHPILNNSSFNVSIEKQLDNAKIQIFKDDNNNSKIIYEGNLQAGIISFNLNMVELFGDKYGFYKCQLLNDNNLIIEKEIFYSDVFYRYQKDENSKQYTSIEFINLKNISKGIVNFKSDLNNLFDKKIDINVSDGRYLGTLKFNNNVRIALIKPYKFSYDDYYQSGYIEHYGKIINYDELIKLKEILFTENDKITN